MSLHHAACTRQQSEDSAKKHGEVSFIFLNSSKGAQLRKWKLPAYLGGLPTMWGKLYPLFGGTEEYYNRGNKRRPFNFVGYKRGPYNCLGAILLFVGCYNCVGHKRVVLKTIWGTKRGISSVWGSMAR